MAGREFRGIARKTIDWYDYQTVAVGRLELPPGAEIPVGIRAGDPSSWRAVNIRRIIFHDVN